MPKLFTLLLLCIAIASTSYQPALALTYGRGTALAPQTIHIPANHPNKLVFSQTEGQLSLVNNRSTSKSFGAYTIILLNKQSGKTTNISCNFRPQITFDLDSNTPYAIQIHTQPPKFCASHTISRTNIWLWLWEQQLGYPISTNAQWLKPPTWQINPTQKAPQTYGGAYFYSYSYLPTGS